MPDQPTYRPVPTTQDRMRYANIDARDTSPIIHPAAGPPTRTDRIPVRAGCGHTPEQHRHDDGQNADAASHDRAMRGMQARLNVMTEAAIDHRKTAGRAISDRDRLAAELATTQQTATFRQGVIELHAAELGAAGEVIAVVRDAVEQVERALARYDTAPEVTPVEPDAALHNALNAAESALIDRDDSVWRPGDLGFWTTRYLEPMTRDDIEQVYGPTRAVLLIDIEQDDEPETEAEAPLGSVSPHAQDRPGPWMNRRALVSDTLRTCMAKREYQVPVPVADRVAEAVLIALDEQAQESEQVLRDRIEHAILARLSAAWPQFDDRVFMDQVAAVAAVAAVNELAKP